MLAVVRGEKMSALSALFHLLNSAPLDKVPNE